MADIPGDQHINGVLCMSYIQIMIFNFNMKWKDLKFSWELKMTWNLRMAHIVSRVVVNCFVLWMENNFDEVS